VAGGGTHFRVWAPKRKKVDVVSGGRIAPLAPEKDGYFSGLAAELKPGDLYKLRLDDSEEFPDPVSRFQPEGPHGPSRIVDPDEYRWNDEAWQGITLRGSVIYEMHIGTFTPEGTYAAAERQLPELAALGINVIELMPLADFSGRFGWGYDGVDMFAPTRLYGEPDDLRRFIDAAHSVGIGVILDVVYNHFGPDGNYISQFSDDYHTDRYENEWGDAINFDGARSGPVREFFITNAAYWIGEYHFDGLRLDATQAIFDNSETHIIGEITTAARHAAGRRSIVVVAENEPQNTDLVSRWDVDALWNDDLHHSAMVALTGRNEAYYSDHRGSPQEFVSAVKYGYLFQGQRYKWQAKRRGTPALRLRPENFVTFIQNHDQVANSARGWRAHRLTSPGRLRAMTALVLLAPGTPMLFQGQEFAASTPYLYFADHNTELAALVREGRSEFLSQFPSLDDRRNRSILADPSDRKTFERSKLDFSERETHREIYQMHRDLLRLRREDPVIRGQASEGIDGAVLGPEAFLLRWFTSDEQDRLLIANFGTDLHLDTAPEPLLAPPRGMEWDTMWSSESQCYGGMGSYPLETEENWHIPGHSAVLMNPKVQETPKDERTHSTNAMANRKQRAG
jgi:maltooligosyltrehalose trehalohydrolase